MRSHRSWIGCSLLALLIAVPLLAAEESTSEGTLELVYRDVSVDGSTQKYDEDFDGLDSGAVLSNLEFRWDAAGSKWVDYLRLDAAGLGGDPYERSAFRLGKKDRYDLRFSRSKQSYLYNLFDVVTDQDASSWNSDRAVTDLGLTIHAADKVELFVGVQDVQRNGTSFFLKDINTDLFQLETPLDQTIRRYTVGANFELGAADLAFRHTLRRYDYDFHNMTVGNPGLSVTDLATLDQYDWVQHDEGEANLTSLSFSVPFGDRVHLSANLYGTLLGNDEIDSQITLDASGTSFLGTCSMTGASCSASNPCATSTPGNVCIANPFNVSGGTSSAMLEADYLAIGADLSVRIVDDLDFHLQVDTLSREMTGVQDRDLDGNGVPDDTEGTILDTTPGSVTQVDYDLSTITGLFVYEPSSTVGVRAGYRRIDRDLTRSGFEYGTNDYRNTPYDSGSDDTLVLGLRLKPVSWFHFDANYEKGEIDQPLTALSPAETDRLRVRASFRPAVRTRIDLSYLAYENSNSGVDFRRPGDCTPGDDIDSGCWNTLAEGTTYSASLWHKQSDSFDFWVRWAQNEVDRVTRIHFDTSVFGATDVGDSVYGNDNTALSGQLNFSWSPRFKAFVRAQHNDSDGRSSILGSMYTNTIPILQEYMDIEAGVTCSLPKDLYVGLRVKTFEYDDFNDSLDYDGEVFSVRVGMHF